MKSLNFKLIFRVAAVAVFAAMGCFAFIPSGNSTVAASEALTESVAQASVYRANCARCHGNDGRSNTKEGRRTEADDLTEDSVKAMANDKIIRIITNGKGDMPGFKRKMTAAQIESVARYIKSL